MKKIKLISLQIENFKGIREKTIAFGDGDCSIFGANATGKTSILDGFTWLLFDKDSTGATKFDIRPLDTDGKTIDNIEISVTAVLDIDGEEVSLKKSQKQNWTKKRGSETAKLQGNTNSYEINGFPANEKEFKEKVSSIVSEDLFKLLTDPRTFAALPWKKQRETLMKFVSGITDADVIATNPVKYEPIADELASAPAEKCLEKANKAMAKLKDSQKELPIRIDQASKSLIDVPELADLEIHRKALQEQLESIRKQRDDAGEAYKVVADLQAEAMKTKLDMGGLEQSANEQLDKRRREARQLHNELQSKAYGLMENRKAEEAVLEKQKVFLQDKQAELDALAGEWRKAKAMTMDESETICKYCGQALPKDKLDEVLKGFEKRKEALVEKALKSGNKARKEYNSIKDKIALLESEIESLRKEWNEATGKTNKAYEAMIAIPEKIDVSEDPEYQVLEQKLARLNDQLSGMDNGEDLKRNLATKEQTIQSELDAVNRQFASVELNEKTHEDIEGLRKELRTVSQQVADQEQKVYLLEEFFRAKMTLLSEAINSKFTIVNFKLFDMQINGGKKDTCEMMMNGVPYSSLNSAGKMQAGLDVIRALQQLYDVSAPIFLDNRESVIDIPDMDAQIINLYVSAADKELRVEVA